MPDDKIGKGSKPPKENPLTGEPRPRARRQAYRAISSGQLEVDTRTGKANFRVLRKRIPLRLNTRCMDGLGATHQVRAYGKVLQNINTGEYFIRVSRGRVEGIREAFVEGIGLVEIKKKASPFKSLAVGVSNRERDPQ